MVEVWRAAAEDPIAESQSSQDMSPSGVSSSRAFESTSG
jgi:hypothetical protein